VEEPRNLKHYELLSRLGEGGMGVVYRARDTRLGREVALKMLPEGMAGSEERSRRFEREARIVSTLSHPGIATLYDFDSDGETRFLTMEFVRGSNLRELLGRGPMAISDLLDCAVQVSEALAAAHRSGVIHRDLKPENIMASESGYYKVLDFGVARLEESDQTEALSTQTPTRTWATRSGSLVGTVAYMSPEQIQGQPADARSDIFAMGSVLYELVTSRQAFQGPNDIAVAHAIVYEEPRSLRASRTDAPPGIELVIQKCLAKQPEQRYQAAEQLAEDLRTLRHTTLSGSRAAPDLLAGRPEPEDRRAKLRLATWTTLAVCLLAAMGWALWQRLGPPTPEAASALAPLPAAAATDAASATVAGQRPRVVVAFFENNTGDDEAQWISRGLPEMITTDLSASEGLDVIATQRLHDLLAAAGQDPSRGLDRSTTAELARWAGADLVISGSVFKAGERYRIDAQAYDTGTGSVVTAYKSEGGDPFPLVSDLTAGLLRGLGVAASGAGQPAVTRSGPAFQAFVRGKERFENLALDEANVELEAALEIDPGFALARLYLAKIAILDGETETAAQMLDQALARAEEMPEAPRLLARALEAFYVDRDEIAGERLIEELTRRFPQNGEFYAWWGRALVDLGRKPLAATRKLGEALRLDPNSILAITALAEQLTRLGQEEEARRLLAEARERSPVAAAIGRLSSGD
jgi:TolB-like protein/Tfp pilus assembly protein PilF/predicted Ser/Thr protein kinase